MIIGVFTVHLIDDEHAADMAELAGVVPRLFRADGHAADSADHDPSGFHHAQGSDRFADKVKISGDVDYVDFIVLPGQRSDGSADGNAALDFFRIVVGNRGAVFHFALAVNQSSSEQHRLC